MERIYICIDLKSFYASVECVERGLNPLKTNLVVADESRSDKTICLAVSPSLKKYGIPGRLRLFDLKQRVKEINLERVKYAPNHSFKGESIYEEELNDPSLSLSYVTATPHMAHYIEVSTSIYQIYLRHVAEEDIHVYSIDEVFMDITKYVRPSGLSPKGFVSMLIQEVEKETGITATAGIGTNLYLAKVAMDIVAKHIPPDENGVRIATLDEMSYRKLLWNHRPLTDFWRVGKGYATRLESKGLFTMGDIARCSVGPFHNPYNEDLLYSMFGIQAELLIDHAWGHESCTMEDIKKYQPDNNSIGSGQVLASPYSYEKGLLVTKEMAISLILDLVDKGLATDRVDIAIGYDYTSFPSKEQKKAKDSMVPSHAHGGVNLSSFTSSEKEIVQAITNIYQKIVNPKYVIRRIYITFSHVLLEELSYDKETSEQLSLFSSCQEEDKEKKKEERKREKRGQKAILAIQKKYGKNSIMKAMDLEEGATTKLRNEQIGGHKA